MRIRMESVMRKRVQVLYESTSLLNMSEFRNLKCNC